MTSLTLDLPSELFERLQQAATELAWIIHEAARGEQRPEGLPRMTARETETDLIPKLHNSSTDLQQHETQRVQLHAHAPQLYQPAPQRVQQPVRRPMQHQAELVRPEIMAAQPVGPTRVLEILDIPFGRAPLDVAIIQRLRRRRPIRDHEAH